LEANFGMQPYFDPTRKTTLKKMEDNIHKKMEDNLKTKDGRRPQKKMEDDINLKN
jgi:hypothetical protein